MDDLNEILFIQLLGSYPRCKAITSYTMKDIKHIMFYAREVLDDEEIEVFHSMADEMEYRLHIVQPAIAVDEGTYSVAIV